MMTDLHGPVIKTRQLEFAYNHYPVLKGIDLEVPAGSIFGFLGPNGAGKSTTIKVLLGLLRVKENSVQIFGKELNKHTTEIHKDIGAMVETPSLYEHLSAARNLEITRRLRNLPKNRINEVLATVGLAADANRQVRQFSTGMKQRLSLAIAMLGNPKLLILDEPINGLDPSGIIEIRNLLHHLCNDLGCTIFLSSHILDEIDKLCNHVAVIDKGRLLYQGDKQALLNQKNGRQKTRIHLSDLAAAASLLQPGTFTIEHQAILLFSEKRETISEVIKKLVQADINIYAVEPEKNDLENSFLTLLNEGGA